MTDVLLRTVRRVGTSGAPCDVRIVDGRIEAVAPAGTLDPPSSVDADVVETDGAWLGPGLVDHHVHFDQWALVRRRVDVSTCTSAEATAASVCSRSGRQMLTASMSGRASSAWKPA